MLKAYKEKIPKKKKPHFRRDIRSFKSAVDDKPLTGYIGDEQASDIEERVARAARKRDKYFDFQVNVQVATSLPNEDKIVDFVFGRMLKQPVEVYGEIGHSKTTDRNKDAQREALLNEAFRKMGWLPLKIIWWYELNTQSMADRTIARKV